MSLRRAALSAAMSLLIAACRPTDSVCPDILEYAISLTVVDSLTNIPPTSVSTIIAVNGTHVDTVTNASGNPMNNQYSIGPARSGAFSVTVKTPGYADWSVAAVNVAADACGIPQGVVLTARLQR